MTTQKFDSEDLRRKERVDTSCASVSFSLQFGGCACGSGSSLASESGWPKPSGNLIAVRAMSGHTIILPVCCHFPALQSEWRVCAGWSRRRSHTTRMLVPGSSAERSFVPISEGLVLHLVT